MNDAERRLWLDEIARREPDRSHAEVCQCAALAHRHAPLDGREQAERSWFHALLSDQDPFTLAELVARPEWQQWGLCRGRGCDPWFPTSPRGVVTLAVALCERCPVRRPCLEYALSLEDSPPVGVWGGKTEDERRAMRRWRRRAKAWGDVG